MKFITAILSAFFCLSIQAQLVTYPGTLSTGMPHNDDYTVRVRIPGGEWKDLFEYNVQVDMDKVQDASMVQFDMGSPVEVMVKKNNGTVREVAIRPLSKGIEYKQIQNAILFTLESHNISPLSLMVTDCTTCIFLPTRWRLKNMKKKLKE